MGWARTVNSSSPESLRLKHPQFKLDLVLLVECCFTSTETVGLLGTGAQDDHLDFHTAPAGALTNWKLYQIGSKSSK